MNDLNIITAFIFGMLAFLSPCTFPLIPSFMSFLAGISVKNLEDQVFTSKHRNQIILSVVLYILGSCLVLQVYGIAAGALGYFLRSNRFIIQRIGGLIIILFGLYIGNFIQIKFFSKGFILNKTLQKINTFKAMNQFNHYLSCFIIAIIFTLGWTPCLSPILGAILTLASISSSAWYGGFMLFIYGIGLNLPFLLIATFSSLYLSYFSFVRRHIYIFSKATGILLVITGILLIIGNFAIITSFLEGVIFRP